MGVVAYARRWYSFLGKYDHWRYLFAEWNKRLYLKSYLSTIAMRIRNVPFTTARGGSFTASTEG